MGQLESSNSAVGQTDVTNIPMPKRTLTVEFWVGAFTMVGMAAISYLAVGLGDFQIFGPRRYAVQAEFDNIAGLKTGASVEIAGVQVGEVSMIQLADPSALVTLNLYEGVRLKGDDIAAIRTKGIIGDRYVKISRGNSKEIVPEGGKITETESAVDIEDLIGKFMHSMGNDESTKTK